METSQYFERTLFYDRSPAADEYYERSADLIFEKDASKARIEVRYQSSIVNFRLQKVRRRKGLSSKDQRNEKELNLKALAAAHPTLCGNLAVHEGLSEKGDKMDSLDYDQSTESIIDLNEASESDDASSISSRASSTALPTALDQRQGDSVPPMYPGLPKLTVDKVDPSNMEEFVQRTKNDFRVFYLRQRHSYSRIQITKQLFEQLLKLCNIFPRFNEYLIGFGSKKSDAEVGPPPLKFRPLCTAHSNAYRGFGTFDVQIKK